MSSNLFTALFHLLLFLLICGTLLCGQLCVNGETPKTSTAENLVKVFETEQKIGDVLKPTVNKKEDKVEEVTVQEFYSPVVVSSGDVIVALAAIKGTDKIDNNITVLTKYIDTKSNANWAENVFKTPAGGEWTAQFAVYGECSQTNCVDSSVVKGLVTAVATNKKIYLFSVNASKAANNPTSGKLTFDLKFGLAVGTVGTGTDKKISWVEEKPLTFPEGQDFTVQIKEEKLSKGAFSGSALVKGEKIIFLLKAQTENQKTVFGFLYLSGEEKAKQLQFLPLDKIAQGCYPQFFLWEEKIIMVSTQCADDASNQKVVKETNDVTTTENKWANSSGPFSQFVDFFQDKSDFTTSTIRKNTNSNSVLLFTQKKKPKGETTDNDNRDVFLWATNGKQFYNAGAFLTNVNVTSINLLYAKDELLALYQKWEEGNPKNIFLMRLETQLDNIATVIDAWKSNDGIAEKLCGDKILCATQLPTDKLVGFLSNNSEDRNKIWKDEYYYVNATLKENNNKKPANVTGGFTFSGEGVGAKWEVGKEKEDQPYNFTDPGFTLVATVTIEQNDPKVDNSLLGVVLNKEKKQHIQLWCSNGKLAVGGGENNVLDKKECEKGKTYIVALVLRDGNVFVHVDWEQMTGLTRDEMKIGKTDIIKYFYFGAGSDNEKTDVTVTNVLLYNRPFTIDEINGLKVIKKEIAQPTTKNDSDNTENLEGNTIETDKPSSTSATPTATEKDGAKTKLCLPLKNEFTVFALLLLVWFTLLGRYV